MRGPIDYIIVKFKDAKFEGKIISELEKAAQAGTIAVLAVSAINKSPDGKVSSLDISNELAAFKELESDLIDQSDVDEVADLLEPGTGAGLLIVEQLWAKDLKQAILDTGGTLVADGRIHPDAMLELEEK